MKNVRQTLRMAALTAVLASAPLSLSNAIASAEFESVTPNASSTPFELAAFVPAPVAPPAADAPPVPDAPPPAPADLPP
ncbi:MAG: resuscitation-promoting factor RpfE, partial [Mycobacterium sp.]|nr:resuscitation-promoting factor RpfE [Mycobacterium sp.]